MFICFSTVIYQVTCSKQTEVTYSAVKLIAMTSCKSKSLHGTNQEGKKKKKITEGYWLWKVYTPWWLVQAQRRDLSFT